MRLSKKARQGIAVFNRVTNRSAQYHLPMLDDHEKALRENKRYDKMRGKKK